MGPDAFTAGMCTALHMPEGPLLSRIYIRLKGQQLYESRTVDLIRSTLKSLEH